MSAAHGGISAKLVPRLYGGEMKDPGNEVVLERLYLDQKLL